MKDQSDDEEWLRWIEVQTEATATWASGDLAGAIHLITDYLEGAAASDLRRKALAFRGDLQEEHGNGEAAAADFLLAHRLSDQPDYERYTLELALGSIAESTRDMHAAGYWYLKALETASANITISGGTGLLRLLEIRDLNEEERLLAEKVARQSWYLLRIEGKPDLRDLKGAARSIIATQSRP